MPTGRHCQVSGGNSENPENDSFIFSGTIDRSRSAAWDCHRRNVLGQIPVQLARENKKFQVSKVSRDARFKDYRGCVEWLRDAGIVVSCYGMNFPELPIRGNYDDSRFKLYMADTGLLVSMLEDESQTDLRANGNLGGWKGETLREHRRRGARQDRCGPRVLQTG